MSDFSIVFAGTPDFAAQHLQALLDANIAVDAVYSQPDRPAGRGKKLQASAVKQVALAHQLAVYQPLNFKDPDDVAQLAALKPDLLIVVAYGLLLPQSVLDIPRLGCINVHASLLPRWRGAAPVERAIEAGDSETGVTIMQMDKGLDTGDMLHKVTLAITAQCTGDSLRQRLADTGSKALINTVKQLQQGAFSGEKQDDSQATYAHKLHKAEAKIDWQLPASSLALKIRAFNSSNVCFGEYQDSRIKIWQADAQQYPHNKPAGDILSVDKQGVLVACGEGALLLRELQLPNARKMPIAAILNGRAGFFVAGQRFV